jgi:hypothetical protein
MTEPSGPSDIAVEHDDALGGFHAYLSPQFCFDSRYYPHIPILTYFPIQCIDAADPPVRRPS